ncbi:hypothetical protein [Streptomyces sp. F001]|uniref:hypothetical protein n=1 Tax=Streptomyces sp. F001 TaxID=1510026 RepID=UPI00101E574E|nr:hypothetical protein [Streptomyces sp. F001]
MHIDLPQYGATARAADEAIRLGRRTGRPEDLANVLLMAQRVQQHLGDWDAALYLMNEAILHIRATHSVLAGAVWWERATILRGLGRSEEAQASEAQSALVFEERVDRREGLPDLLS